MLQLHRATDTAPLVAELATILAHPDGDPLAPQVVAVPEHGLERWLAQQLAGRLGAGPGAGDGICANVAFPLLPRLLADALAMASGIEPERDPWRPERTLWPLLELAAACAEQPWMRPLTHYLQGTEGRRLGTLRKVAYLYDSYAIYRPELLLHWAGKEPLEAGQRDDWQPQLWRALRERLGVASPPERFATASAALSADPALLDLPECFAVFGVAQIAASQLQLLAVIAQARTVHLLALHPSPALWRRTAAKGQAPPRNRLLAAWGHEARELQQVVEAAEINGSTATDSGAAAEAGTAEAADAAAGARRQPTTLLAQLQADIAADVEAPGGPRGDAQPDHRLRLAADDRSVVVHSCHGAARQVEVLRDEILHRCAADPAMEPRDVLILCPDVERFAPLIEASFGASLNPATAAVEVADQTSSGPVLPVRIGDRPLRQTNPLLTVLQRLLELPASRITATDLLDLADREPVRARFGFDDEDVAQIREWVEEGGVRWGLDQAHRSPYKLEGLELGTWHFGLQRLLLGVAADPQTLVGGALGLAHVGSSQIDLAGRLSELVERIGTAVDAFATRHAPAAWVQVLLTAIDSVTATAADADWQRWQLRRILRELVDDSDGDNAETELTLAEVRVMLDERLTLLPGGGSFGGGELAVRALAPMRVTPHRLICLLGLDDGTFPHSAAHDGDDLLVADPRPGDRNSRYRDRRLLLEALMAAREALIITYAGHDERTNAARPPAIPVGELLDVVDATTRWEHNGRALAAREHVRVVHPLQGFDPANFRPGELIAGGPWGYDPAALAGAQALLQPTSPAPALLSGPLAPLPRPTLVSLEGLIRFVQSPPLEFLRQRLGLPRARKRETLGDTLPIEPDGLGEWRIGQNLLDSLLGGASVEQALSRERARGLLPPGNLGERLLQMLMARVSALIACAHEELGDGQRRSWQPTAVLDDGARVTGTVADVSGTLIGLVGYGRLRPAQRLAAWVRLLTLSAAYPEEPFEATTIARAEVGEGLVVARIPALADDAEERSDIARLELAELVDLYRDGMCEPLPLPPRSTAAYAQAWERQQRSPGAEGALETAEKKAQEAAGKEWHSSYGHDGEDRDADLALAFGAGSPLPYMHDYALALWSPLLERESLSRHEPARRS